MENSTKTKITDILIGLKNRLINTTKKQRIIFLVIILLLIACSIYGKILWRRYKIVKRAENIVAKISKSEMDFFKINGKYREDIFRDRKLARDLRISSTAPVTRSSKTSKTKNRRSRRRTTSQTITNEVYDMGYSGDYYIQINADNACLVLKYKKNTLDKTTFYASFDKKQLFCLGRNCLKESEDETKLCYINGECIIPKQKQETKRSCGNGNGTQTRECTPNCKGGSCKDWGECICKKGFEWDGKTCKQMQTEKDCTKDQCYNGLYCEEKESLTKDIENGSCKRNATCKKDGWKYSSWNCSCNNDTLCPVNEKCLPYPGDKDKIDLPNKEGFCTNIYYSCNKGQEWVTKANDCVCNKIGTFWDAKKGEAKCSNCTKKPANSIFTSTGGTQNNCSWECAKGYELRDGECLKPNGQYLCVATGTQICTDDFSKSRKLKVDEKNNEGQLCFTEDNDNILYYDKKTQNCQICQCVTLKEDKASR